MDISTLQALVQMFGQRQQQQPVAQQKSGIASLNLTPQEHYLYQMHLNNLAKGGVKNPDGSTSTLRQMTAEINGRVYNIPTVWDNKLLKPDEAMKRAEQVGFDKFPSYASEPEAQQRYDAMHSFLEKDVMPQK